MYVAMLYISLLSFVKLPQVLTNNSIPATFVFVSRRDSMKAKRATWHYRFIELLLIASRIFVLAR